MKTLIASILLATLIQADYVQAPNGDYIQTPDGNIYNTPDGNYQGIPNTTRDPDGNYHPDYDAYYEETADEENYLHIDILGDH